MMTEYLPEITKREQEACRNVVTAFLKDESERQRVLSMLDLAT